MGVGSGLYMYDVVVKRSRSLSHLLMSSCYIMHSCLLSKSVNYRRWLCPYSGLMSCTGVANGQLIRDQCRHAGQRLVSGWSQVADWTQNDENVVHSFR